MELLSCGLEGCDVQSPSLFSLWGSWKRTVISMADRLPEILDRLQTHHQNTACCITSPYFIHGISRPIARSYYRYHHDSICWCCMGRDIVVEAHLPAKSLEIKVGPLGCTGIMVHSANLMTQNDWITGSSGKSILLLKIISANHKFELSWSSC